MSADSVKLDCVNRALDSLPCVWGQFCLRAESLILILILLQCFPTGCNLALYFLVFLNISEKHEVHIIMVVASKMGDCHIDLYWIDLQLCHEDEHIHCNLEGNFEEKEFLPNQGF